MARRKRKNEKIGTGVGVVAGAVAGAKIGAGVGLAAGGWAMAATVPFGILGGAVIGLLGNKIGTEIDRASENKDNPTIQDPDTSPRTD